MKPLNNKAIRKNRLKFISMYCVSVALIIIMLCSFLISKPVVKTVVLKQVTTVKNNIRANTQTIALTDSLNNMQNTYNKKIETLQASLNNQHNIVLKLQSELKLNQINKKPANTEAELTALNKQIEFLNWALRSQVVVTNTLTKENNALKSGIEKLKN